MNPVTDLSVPSQQSAPLSLSDLREQVNLIQHIMREVMKEGEHFGVIPGTDKPTLLKPGAEKLALTFRMAPSFAITKTDLPGQHREYEIVCTLTHITTGRVLAQGVGSCSTMEAKYRYRNVADFTVLDEPIPKDAKERKQQYRQQGLGMKKIDGEWKWVKYGDSHRSENPDLADTYNTVLKMAKKRAQVDATLTATAASDIFTQDLEENVDNGGASPPPPAKPAAASPSSDSVTPPTSTGSPNWQPSEAQLKMLRAMFQKAKKEGVVTDTKFRYLLLHICRSDVKWPTGGECGCESARDKAAPHISPVHFTRSIHVSRTKDLLDAISAGKANLMNDGTVEWIGKDEPPSWISQYAPDESAAEESESPI